jgi:putative peptidoglycan lipid II flippase
VLQYYAAGLVGYAALKVIVPAFYALRQARKPMVVSFIGIAVNFILCSTFTSAGPVHFGSINLGTKGLALATSCSAVLNAGILLLMLRSLLEKRMDFRETLAGLLRVGAASAVMGFGVFGLWKLFQVIGIPQVTWLNIAQLLVLVVVGVLIFLAAARFLRIQEVRDLTDMVLKKLYGDSTEAARKD